MTFHFFHWTAQLDTKTSTATNSISLWFFPSFNFQAHPIAKNIEKNVQINWMNDGIGWWKVTTVMTRLQLFLSLKINVIEMMHYRHFAVYRRKKMRRKNIDWVHRFEIKTTINSMKKSVSISLPFLLFFFIIFCLIFDSWKILTNGNMNSTYSGE